MIRRLWLAACIAAFLAFPAPWTASAAEGIDAAALLAKHQAYVGWQAGDGVVKTLRMSGTITRRGKQTGTLRRLYYGLAHRDTTVNEWALSYDEGFTGKLFWSTSPNGFTVPSAGDAARSRADDDTVFGEHTAMLSPSFLRRQTVDGIDTVVLRLKSDVAFPIDVAVDPSTGAYRAITVDPGGAYEHAYRDVSYTEIDGKHFLTGWRRGTSSVALTSVEPNVAVTADDVHPPKQTASWAFGEAPAPVHFADAQARIFVDGTVNGVKGRFILDTGASATLLTDSVARRVKAKRVGSSQFAGIGPNRATATTYRVDTIGIGGSTLHDVLVHGGAYDAGMEADGAVGIIGFDLLAGALVDLDFDAGTLRVLDPAVVGPDASQGIVLRVDLSTYTMRVPMKVDGRVDVTALLDTGNPLRVLFSRDLRSAGVSFSPDASHPYGPVALYGGGVGGVEIEQCGKLASLDLGPVRYERLPACLSPSMERSEILVGLDFLRHFNYVFDYPHGTVVMTLRKGS